MLLEVSVDDAGSAIDTTAIAGEQVRRFDRDASGDLNRAEVEGAAEPLRKFDAVDLDGDDKITAGELGTYLARRQAIQRTDSN